MKKKILAAALAGIVILLSPALVGCDRELTKWDKCLEAGGSPKDHGWGTDCYMPGTDDR